MKILFIDTAPLAGRAEVYLLQLVKFLHPRHKIHFLLSSKNPLLDQYQRFGKTYCVDTGQSVEKWKGFNIYLCSYKKTKSDFLVSLIKADFDIIFFAGYLKDLFLFVDLFPQKKVFILHVSLPSWVFGFPFKTKFLSVCKKLGRIITISEFSRLKFLEHFSEQREKTISTSIGVDIDKFSPAEVKEREKIKRKLLISTPSLVIGNTSRIHPLKGQVHLVRIFQRLKEKYPHLALLFVNSGSWFAESQLKWKIGRHLDKKGCFWFKFQQDISDFYKIMDIFVLPSFSENFPVTVLEAMSTEIAVVAFSIAGIPEQIEDGETGFLIKPGDYFALQNRIEELINNEELRKRMGKKAREKIKEKFNQKIIFANLERMLKELL